MKPRGYSEKGTRRRMMGGEELVVMEEKRMGEEAGVKKTVDEESRMGKLKAATQYAMGLDDKE